MFRWGCGRCGREEQRADSHRELPGTPEELEERRRWLRNCDGETNPNIAWAWAPELRRCPWSQIPEAAWVVVDIWRQWREYRETPWGGMGATPNPVAEALEACELGVASVTQAKEARERREAERKLKEAQRRAGRGR